jgi:hypothetical protein
LTAPPPDARAVTVAGARLSKWLDGFADRHGALTTTTDDRHVVVTGADGSIAWIEVPFGPFVLGSAGPLTALQVHVNRTRRIGVLLVRRGGYAAGIFVGTTLISSKVGSSYVQGTTKAGGWSQQRYARRRANQASAAFAEAADVAAQILLPDAANLDALICGGDRAAIRAILDDPRLLPLVERVREPFLAVPDPRLRVLRATPEQFLAVRISIHP